MPASLLFAPLELRSVRRPNRVVISPMCQYSATDGFAGDWHFAHLAKFAIGRAGVVFTELLQWRRRDGSRTVTWEYGATNTSLHCSASPRS